MENEKNPAEEKIALTIGDAQKVFSHEELEALVKKGLSYAAVEPELNALKELANEFSLTLPQSIKEIAEHLKAMHRAEVLERCSGDEALAESFLQLEEKEFKNIIGGIAEVSEFFPDIRDEKDLPTEVIIASAEKKTSLLDEYLRYQLRLSCEAKKLKVKQSIAARTSVGTLRDADTQNHDPVRNEFIKGLWRK